MGIQSHNVSLVIREDQRQGQLIGNYSLECGYGSASASADSTGALQAATQWQACPMGSLDEHVISSKLYPGVGHKRILLLAPYAGNQTSDRDTLVWRALRFVVKSHFATGSQIPALRDMVLYDWSGDIEQCV